jgi:hypothetical protein
MPRRTPTRSSCKRLPRYKASATAAQIIAGMRRHFVHGDSIRNAIDYVNGQSGKLANSCLLTKDTLHRMIVAAALRLAEEVAVLEWLHDFELQRRARLSTSIAERNGQKLFSKVEEEVIAQWMCVMCSVNLAVGKSAVSHARTAYCCPVPA